MSLQKLSLDEHEHLITLYNLPLMKKKAIQELHGAASAIIYDGEVTNDEIDFIAAWIDRNRIVHDVWPVSRLIEILTDITKDNVITNDERFELFTFLIGISSDPVTKDKTVTGIFTENPNITIPNHCFLFTGTLEFGKRQKAENAVMRCGGICCERYKNDVDYLVVGDLGQEAWKYSRYGTKIEACMKAKTKGTAKTNIVRERDFVMAVIGAGQ